MPTGIDASVWAALDAQTRRSLWLQLEPPPTGMELEVWSQLGSQLRQSIRSDLGGTTTQGGASTGAHADVIDLTDPDEEVAPTTTGPSSGIAAVPPAATPAPEAASAATGAASPPDNESKRLRRRQRETTERVHALAKACYRDAACCRQVAEICSRSRAHHGASLFNDLQRVAEEVQARHDISQGGYLYSHLITNSRSDGEKCQQLVLQFLGVNDDAVLEEILDETEPLVQHAKLISAPPSAQKCQEMIAKKQQEAASLRTKAAPKVHPPPVQKAALLRVAAARKFSPQPAKSTAVLGAGVVGKAGPQLATNSNRSLGIRLAPRSGVTKGLVRARPFGR